MTSGVDTPPQPSLALVIFLRLLSIGLGSGLWMLLRRMPGWMEPLSVGDLAVIATLGAICLALLYLGTLASTARLVSVWRRIGTVLYLLLTAM